MTKTPPSDLDQIAAFWDAFGNAWVAAAESIAANMTLFAAEINEAAKKFPEREYWRGYQDGFNDARLRVDAEGESE